MTFITQNFRLKPALQAQSETVIIPTESKKASSAQGYTTSSYLRGKEKNMIYDCFTFFMKLQFL